MSTKLPITALILTKDEGSNIRDCIESVSFADDIIVVDSGSTDGTPGLARQYADKVYDHVFENYALQRNWAQDTLPIKNDWVLHIDADERLSSEAAAELNKIFSAGRIDADGFIISRKTFFEGRWIRFGGHYPAYHLRLFRRSKGRCEDRLYDQHFIVYGKIGRLGGDLINIIEPLEVLRKKQERWARLEADEILSRSAARGKPYDPNDPIAKKRWLKNNVYYKLPIFIRPLLYFFYRYFLRLGFLDGKEGLKFHFYQGFRFRFLVDKNIFGSKYLKW